MSVARIVKRSFCASEVPSHGTARIAQSATRTLHGAAYLQCDLKTSRMQFDASRNSLHAHIRDCDRVQGSELLVQSRIDYVEA